MSIQQELYLSIHYTGTLSHCGTASQAAIQKFESFAGRAAMIGFVACAVGEMVVDVPSVQQTDPAAVLASLLLALTTGWLTFV